MKTIGIIGTRSRDSQADLLMCEKKFFEIYEKGDKLVSGRCSRGGDRFCEYIANKYSIPIKIYPADWKQYGKAAGFIRNEYIAKDADTIMALLPNDGSHSYGTEDTIQKAIKLGKQILLVDQPSIEEFDPLKEV